MLSENIELPVDQAAMLDRSRRALMDHLPKELILASYQTAGGQEMQSGKFVSPESSAALVANAFGLFLDRPELLSLPAPAVAAGSVSTVSLETQMRFPWSGGLHPWLDVVVETPERLIGIESKRYEPFRDAKSASFSNAYVRPVWGENMKPYEAMRDALADGAQRFNFLDAAQLVKHAFGLRTQALKRGKKASLVYLFSEPGAYPDGRSVSGEDKQEHRKETSGFAKAVGNGDADVRFHSICYADLLSGWSQSADNSVRNHAVAVRGRFDV